MDVFSLLFPGQIIMMTVYTILHNMSHIMMESLKIFVHLSHR